LLSSVPLLDPTQASRRVHLTGEIPSPTDVPSGCPFHTRCPRYLGRICETETPPVRETADGRRIACHIPLAELEREQPSMGTRGPQPSPGASAEASN
jgi:peptide/nickel transport system ATP-binding protein